MAYTRPDFDAAHASWAEAAPYTQPNFDAADVSWFVAPTATYEFFLTEDSGLPLQPEIYIAHLFQAYLTDDEGILGAPSLFLASDSVYWMEVESPLGAPEFLFTQNWVLWLEDSGLPLPFSGVAFTDPSPYINPLAPTRYSMELVAADGSSIRVPISSWQATLQTGDQCYAACVVPACGPYVDALNAAAEFVIWRQVQLKDGASAELLAVRSPLEQLTLTQGHTNYSASLAGYFDAFAVIDDPDEMYDRELSGVQIASTYPSGTRIRAKTDWLLQPGQRAVWGSTSFVVGYINYYVNETFDYMDVGYRQ